MVVKLIVFVAILATTSAYRIKSPIELPLSDAGLNVKQLIEKYDYPFENHTVTTEDGYLLELHRIPHGKEQTQDGNRTPVLIFPGLLCESSIWVNMGPNNSLGFILADQGFDVWLANYRGTRWSRKHVALDPDTQKKEFFNYSFHEIGYYDTPAIVDHILAVAQQESLFYIGHSQGTTTYFVFSTTRPEYNSKIRLSIALAPVSYANHMTSILIQILSFYSNKIEDLAEEYDVYEILRYNPLVSSAAKVLCDDDSPLQELCAFVIYFLAGYSPDQLNKTMIPVMLSNLPAGGSMKQMLHFTQLYDSGTFRQYDHGPDINMRIYGQLTPPDYDLSKISSPLAMYYGNLDHFTREEDVTRLALEVPNLVTKKKINGFNHADMLWGIDVVKLLFNDLVDIMKLYK